MLNLVWIPIELGSLWMFFGWPVEVTIKAYFITYPFYIATAQFIHPRKGRMHWEVRATLQSVSWTPSGDDLWIWLQLKRGTEMSMWMLLKIWFGPGMEWYICTIGIFWHNECFDWDCDMQYQSAIYEALGVSAQFYTKSGHQCATLRWLGQTSLTKKLQELDIMSYNKLIVYVLLSLAEQFFVPSRFFMKGFLILFDHREFLVVPNVTASMCPSPFLIFTYFNVSSKE